MKANNIRDTEPFGWKNPLRSTRQEDGSALQSASSLNSPSERLSGTSRCDVTDAVEVKSSLTATIPPAQSYSMRELVATLSHQKDTSHLSPELERRVLDFRLAQQKRLEKYGNPQKWGIFGLYAHLSSVRIDLEWSEDAAWRRTNGKPYLSWSDFDAMQIRNPVRKWFTYTLIVTCSVMLLVEFALNDWKVEKLSVNPLIGPSAEAMVKAGARDTNLIIEGQWFRLFSPLFLHGGIIHYVVNMAAFWFMYVFHGTLPQDQFHRHLNQLTDFSRGGAVEESHGLFKTLFLFFVPGVGGNILGAIFLPQYISVGASGGIFGLIGGCITDISLNWKLLFICGREHEASRRRNVSAILCLVCEVAINLLIGLTPYVDNFSHLGGMLYGVFCGMSALVPLPVGFFGVSASRLEKLRKGTIRFFGVILSLVLIIITTAVLATMKTGDSPCPGCRYISCVPFPFWTNEKWWYCDDCDFVTATLYRSPDGNRDYDVIDLFCPGGTVETIPINGTLGADDEIIRRTLPTYCREFCTG